MVMIAGVRFVVAVVVAATLALVAATTAAGEAFYVFRVGVR